MIIDNIKNAKDYYSLGERFQKAFEYIINMPELENGKYEIDGENIFISIQDYTSKPISEGRWEAHKKYADIQFIIKGEEQIGYTPIDTLSEESSYDNAKDIIFLSGEGQFAKVKKGDFIIFLPQDAHMPCICTNKPSYVKKAVAKIKL